MPALPESIITVGARWPELVTAGERLSGPPAAASRDPREPPRSPSGFAAFPLLPPHQVSALLCLLGLLFNPRLESSTFDYIFSFVRLSFIIVYKKFMICFFYFLKAVYTTVKGHLDYILCKSKCPSLS